MQQIVVDCERNDLVDVKCGGPITLGFDFFVNDTNVGDMIDFIKEELHRNKLPLMHISHKDCIETTAWTKEMIRDCIKGGY